jgi:hypothetical protein
MIHGITVVVVVVVYFNGPIPLRYIILDGATRNWGIVYDPLWVVGVVTCRLAERESTTTMPAAGDCRKVP